jgi:hypothetical protein
MAYNWKVSRLKLKCLKNLTIVSTKWCKSTRLVSSYYILKKIIRVKIE